MSLHDRRPGKKSSPDDSKYQAFFNSDHWETLQSHVDKTILRLRLESASIESLDSYTMASLRRDGRIEGLQLLLRELENLANKRV